MFHLCTLHPFGEGLTLDIRRTTDTDDTDWLTLRSEFIPEVDPDEQREFVRDVFPGVVMCITTYVMVTAFRKFKDYFPGELFAAMLAGTGTRGENTDSSTYAFFSSIFQPVCPEPVSVNCSFVLSQN